MKAPARGRAGVAPEPRYAKFRAVMTPKSRDLKASWSRLAAHLDRTPDRGVVQFRVVEGVRPQVASLYLGVKTRVVEGQAEAAPDLEIVTRGDTWREIAGGKLSPVDAFLMGRLRVRGDYELGKRLLRQLSSDPSAAVDPCEGVG